MSESHAFTRRNFLKASGLTAISLGGATFLTACGPSTATTSSSSSDSSSSKASFGDNGTMRVGMEVAYPPFNWQVSEATDNTIPVEGQSGAYADGYDIYFAKLIADKLDLEPVAVKMEFSGLVEALKNGQIDLICAGMTATDERRQSIGFSDAYCAGAAVLGQRDTLLDDVIDEIDGVNHLTPVDSVPAQISSLNSGACDAITFDVENEKGILASNPGLVAVQINGSDGGHRRRRTRDRPDRRADQRRHRQGQRRHACHDQ